LQLKESVLYKLVELKNVSPEDYAASFGNWPQNPTILLPDADSTGAGPDITILTKTNATNPTFYAIFISLKSSGTGMVSKNNCQAGTQSTDSKNFWGAGKLAEYKKQVIEELWKTRRNIYRIHICCLYANVLHTNEKNIYYWSIDDLKNIVKPGPTL